MNIIPRTPKKKNEMKIAYLVVDNGIDGREPDNIVFASWNAEKRDTWFDTNPNKNWYRKVEKIVEVEKTRTMVLKSLDGLEKLVLNIYEN